MATKAKKAAVPPQTRSSDASPAEGKILPGMPVDPGGQSRWLRQGGLDLLTWPALDGLGVTAVVSSRGGGVSPGPYTGLNLGLHVGDDAKAVLANRAALASALGKEPGDFVFAEQAHGPHVSVVGEQDRGRGSISADDALKNTDAVVTATPGLVLAVLVADCVPILLVDPVNRLLACVHAGWRGTVTGVTHAAMDQLRQLGGDPASMVACIGPAIHPRRYEVGEDVVDAALAAFGSQAPKVITPAGNHKWKFDLWGASTRQLLREGVPASQIHVAELDTGAETPFYSHRSEAPTGRFGLFAWLHPQDQS